MLDEFYDDMQRKIDDIQRRIDDLQKRTDALRDEVLRKEGQAHVNVLKTRKETLQRRMADMRSTSGDAWAAAKQEVQEVYEDLASYISRVYDKYSGGQTGLY